MPDPYSRDFVRHLAHSQYGRNYAQKHPDEDFAETFAVWLTPRAGWKTKYRFWSAVRKLHFVARVMRSLRGKPAPAVADGPLLNPVSDMKIQLAEHYGQRAERYRAAAQGYVDDKLTGVFPRVRSASQIKAGLLIQRNRQRLAATISLWSGLNAEEVTTILDKLIERSAQLRLRVPQSKAQEKLLEITSLATSLAKDFAYTGRFTG